MNHDVNKTANGTTLTIANGDTITLTLPYDIRQTRKTSWSFGNNYRFNACLSLDAVDFKHGIRTMVFRAHKVGVIQLAMHKYWVLGIEENHVTDRFELAVTVA